MIYLPEDYHSYYYLVEAHDNYLILSNSRRIVGESGDSDSVHVVYQYLTPSTYTIPGTYSSEQSFSFIDVSSLVSDSIFDRPDFPILFICNFLICVIFTFVINQLSKLVYKGGLFGSN